MPADIKNKIRTGSDPVLTDKSVHAIDLLTAEPVLSALYNIKYHVTENAPQGTSPLEGLNFQLNANKPHHTSGTTYMTTHMFVSSVVYKNNLRSLTTG